VLDWHRQLGFTLGVTEDLLPLGEQIGVLQSVRDLWWLVIPLTGVAVGTLGALIGLLAGGLTASLLNRFTPGFWLEVEVPEEPAGVPAAEGEGARGAVAAAGRALRQGRARAR
jgi:hypothetical protein